MKHYLIELDKSLKENKIDYQFVGNIHDEVQIQVKEEQASLVTTLAEKAFITVTDTLNFRCKLEGEAKVGKNWMETH